LDPAAALISAPFKSPRDGGAEPFIHLLEVVARPLARLFVAWQGLGFAPSTASSTHAPLHIAARRCAYCRSPASSSQSGNGMPLSEQRLDRLTGPSPCPLLLACGRSAPYAAATARSSTSTR
jgi:hypothetical protein